MENIKNTNNQKNFVKRVTKEDELTAEIDEFKVREKIQAMQDKIAKLKNPPKRIKYELKQIGEQWFWVQ